jgi:hypothetical protein
MRRFFFGHQPSSSRSQSASKSTAPTRRIRRLAFQTLERRDLKAGDTMLNVALAQVPSTTPTSAEVAQAWSTVQAVAEADTPVQIPAAPVTADVSLPQDGSLGQTTCASQAAALAVTSTPAVQPVVSSTTMTGNAESLPTNAVIAPPSNGTQGAAQTGAASRECQSPATQTSTSATAENQGAVGSQATAATGVSARLVSAAEPNVAVTAAHPTKSNLISSNASGGAAGIQAAAVTSADSTSSQDGYGGGTDGYGGNAGSGQPTDGYGGSAVLLIDDLSVSATSSVDTFTGNVSGEPSLAGSTVTFGGPLAGYTTTVKSDGSFLLVVPASPPIQGAVTVQVTALDGATSNIATIYMS